MTWTDEEMKLKLTEMGYDLTDESGNFSELIFAELAAHVEGYK